MLELERTCAHMKQRKQFMPQICMLQLETVVLTFAQGTDVINVVAPQEEISRGVDSPNTLNNRTKLGPRHRLLKAVDHPRAARVPREATGAVRIEASEGPRNPPKKGTLRPPTSRAVDPINSTWEVIALGPPNPDMASGPRRRRELQPGERDKSAAPKHRAGFNLQEGLGDQMVSGHDFWRGGLTTDLQSPSFVVRITLATPETVNTALSSSFASLALWISTIAC